MGVELIDSMDKFNEVLAQNDVVIVDFTASWCGPCKQIGPKFEAMSADFPNIKFVKVDVDECSDVAEKYGVSAMPTFKVFKNKEKVDELVGASEAKLKELCQKYN